MLSRIIISIGILSLMVGQPTEVGGIISENTTWTSDNRPTYVVTAPLLVNGDVTLTIEPGVQVLFRKEHIYISMAN